MKFFKSTDVKVFPCTYRGQDNEGKYFNQESIVQTEFNFVNSSNSHLQSSYIIPTIVNNHEIIINNNTLKCVIKGYYFEISHLDTYGFDAAVDFALGILLVDSNIGTSSETTKVLGYINKNQPSATQGSLENLDRENDTDHEYYFYGLAYIDGTDNNTALPASLYTLSIKENNILQAKNLLPRILHDTTENSIYVMGNTTIDGETNLNNNVNIADNKTLTAGSGNNKTAITNGAIVASGTGGFGGKVSANDGLNVAGASLTVSDDKFIVATTGAITTESSANIKGNTVLGTGNDKTTYNASTNKFDKLNTSGSMTVDGQFTAASGATIEGGTTINSSDININTDGTQATPNSNNTTIGSADNYTGTTTIYGSVNIPSAINIDWDSTTGKLTIKRGLNYPATNN